MTDAQSRAALAVEYFDGRSTRPRPVQLSAGADALRIDGDDGLHLEVPFADVQWPERQRHGARVAHLADGGSLHAPDAAAWDAFAQAIGRRDSAVVRAQQSWRGVLAAFGVLLVVLAAGYVWGVPLAARGAVALLPPTLDRAIGDAALASIEDRWLQPSALPAEQRRRLADAFREAVQATYPAGERPAYDLRFHQSRIGPNAFALPGGTVVLTDELVKLVDGRQDIVVGVLAHELGHVRARHGMRALVQVTLIGAVTTLVVGDFSSLLAAAPALLGQLAYSRDFEREADDESIRVLRAARLSPDAMAALFEKLRRARGHGGGGDGTAIGIALGSHPPDAERLERFREAARGR